MKTIKLAEALLRRKELQEKVNQLRNINQNQLFETKGKRTKVTDDIDDIVLTVPKLYAKQVTEEYDYYAKALRLVDAAIQQTNWTADVSVDPKVMDSYTPERAIQEYK